MTDCVCLSTPPDYVRDRPFAWDRAPSLSAVAFARHPGANGSSFRQPPASYRELEEFFTLAGPPLWSRFSKPARAADRLDPYFQSARIGCCSLLDHRATADSTLGGMIGLSNPHLRSTDSDGGRLMLSRGPFLFSLGVQILQ